MANRLITLRGQPCCFCTRFSYYLPRQAVVCGMPEEEVKRVYSERKQEFASRLEGLIAGNKHVLIISADNVGSQQMHMVRAELRKGPKAEILMGKNTMIKYVLRKYATNSGQQTYNKLADLCKLNVGLVFTNDDMSAVRDVLEKNKVVAAAKAGAVAQCDVVLPAGPTGLEPTQTSFFQALGIATKINKGSIEIISQVQLAKKGEKVGSSEAVLLTKLGLKPFAYGLVVVKVFSEGAVLSPEVLNVTNADVIRVFQQACQKVASVGLAIGYPVAPAVPHMVINGFKNLINVSLVTGVTFKQAEKIKDIIANPSKYASAAPAAAAPAAGKAAAPAAAKKEPEPEPEEDMGFSLFD